MHNKMGIYEVTDLLFCLNYPAIKLGKKKVERTQTANW